MAGVLGGPVGARRPERRPRGASPPASPRPPSAWAATSWSCSTSAATCSPTATSRASPARWPTRSLLAAAPRRRRRARRTVGVVFGAGCDGELTPGRGRASGSPRSRAAGGDLGSSDPSPRRCDRLEAALPHVPTEASAMAVRCARGETRPRRRSAAGAAPSSSPPTAGACSGSTRGAAMRRPRGSPRRSPAPPRPRGRRTTMLTARGVRTELAYELDAAARLRPRCPGSRRPRRASPRATTRRTPSDVVGVLELLEGTRERLATRPARRARGPRRRRAPERRPARPRPAGRARAAPAHRARRPALPGRLVHAARDPRARAARCSRRARRTSPGSREMLLLTPAALYAQLAAGLSNPALPPPLRPRTAARLRAQRLAGGRRRPVVLRADGARAAGDRAAPARGRRAVVPARHPRRPAARRHRARPARARGGRAGRGPARRRAARATCGARSSAPSAGARSCTRRAPGARTSRWPSPAL